MSQRFSITVALCWLAICLAQTGCDADPKTEAGADASPTGSGSGEGSCWVSSRSGLCPEQPRGSRPEDCPSGRIFEGSGFAAGTGPCQPHLPNWECPQDWSQVPLLTDGSGSENPPDGMPQSYRCEPPPMPASCPAGTFARVGSDACQPLGTACPTASERWPDEATIRAHAAALVGPIIYAAPDAAVDGAGTRESPRLLSAGTLRAAETGIVALAIGSYNTPVRLDRRVALVGACVTGTTLTSDQPSDNAGVIDISSGAPIVLANLSITGERPGVWIRGSLPQPHLLSDLELRETRQHAIVGNAPQAVELRRIRVDSVRPRASDGFAARGIEFTAGAQVTIAELDLAGADMVGLLVSDPDTRLTADHLFLHDMAPRAGSTGGSGLAIVNRANAIVRELIVARAAGGALYVDDAVLDATDLLLEETRPQRLDDAFGEGAALNNGAIVTLQRAIVRRTFRVGISVGIEARLTLSDALIEDTFAQQSDGDFGEALIAFEGGQAVARSVVVRRSHSGAVRVSNNRSLLRLSDSLIEETDPRPLDDVLGLGFEAFDAGTGTLERTYLRGNHEAGVLVIGVGSSLDASDLTIVDTEAPSEAQRIGVGIGVRDGGSMRASRLQLARNLVATVYVRDPLSTFDGTDLVITPGPYAPDTVGLLSSDGAAVNLDRATLTRINNLGILATGAASTVSAANLLIAETAPDLASGLDGRAIEVTGGAHLALATALLKDNHDISLLAIDEGTEVTATDLAVEGTLTRIAPLNDFGTALGIYDDARFTGTRIALLNNAQCGLQLAGTGASFDIDGATISGNRVGLSLQFDAADAAFVREHLRGETFSDNGEDVAFETLPVPDPSGTLP